MDDEDEPTDRVECDGVRVERERKEGDRLDERKRNLDDEREPS